MANVKVSQLTAKGSNLEASDRIAIAQDTGGGTFASKYVTGAEVRNRAKATFTSQHTLTLTDANKVVELNFNSGNNLIIPTNTAVAFPVLAKPAAATRSASGHDAGTRLPASSRTKG